MCVGYKKKLTTSIVYCALLKVVANAYLAQASLPKADTSAPHIPCSYHVCLCLPGTVRISLRLITLYLLNLRARLLICNLLKSCYVLRSFQTVSQKISKWCFQGFHDNSSTDISSTTLRLQT